MQKFNEHENLIVIDFYRFSLFLWVIKYLILQIHFCRTFMYFKDPYKPCLYTYLHIFASVVPPSATFPKNANSKGSTTTLGLQDSANSQQNVSLAHVFENKSVPNWDHDFSSIIIHRLIKSFLHEATITAYYIRQAPYTRANFRWQVSLAELDDETRPCVRTPSFNSLDLLKI